MIAKMSPILSNITRSVGRASLARACLARASILQPVQRLRIPPGESIQAKPEPSGCVGAERFLTQNIAKYMYQHMNPKPMKKAAKEPAPSHVASKKPAPKKKVAHQIGSYVPPAKTSTQQDQARSQSISRLIAHSFRPLPIGKPDVQEFTTRAYSKSVGDVSLR